LKKQVGLKTPFSYVVLSMQELIGWFCRNFEKRERNSSYIYNMNNEDKDHTLLISNAIGYMLKVIKSGQNDKKFKKEFNAIKHGDYDEFLDLIKEPQAFMVQWSHGVIKTEKFSKRSGDCDFAMIIAAGTSIETFLKKCFAEYGPIIDNDVSDLIFLRCAAFEISFRNHYNNMKVTQGISWAKKDLVDIIDEVCATKGISQNNTDALQQGRRFLNKVKGHKDHFNSWLDGIDAFNTAWNVRNEHSIQLY